MSSPPTSKTWGSPRTSEVETRFRTQLDGHPPGTRISDRPEEYGVGATASGECLLREWVPTPLVRGEPHVLEVGGELMAEALCRRSEHIERRLQDLGADTVSTENGDPPLQGRPPSELSFSNSIPSRASACSALLSALM